MEQHAWAEGLGRVDVLEGIVDIVALVGGGRDEALHFFEPIKDDMESWPCRLLVLLNHEEALTVG